MNSTSPSSEPITARTTLQRWVRTTVVSLLAVVVLIGLSLGAFTLVMASVPAYRAQMQGWISERARLDIQFDSLRAGWRGYGPELVFTQATLRSIDRKRVVAIAERGSVGFDLWQALRTGRLIAARFTLEGTELKLQRNQDGSFEFIGQADWPEYETDSSFKLDSLPVGTLAIRKVRFSFRDLKTGRGPWTLSDISLDINRDAQQFSVKGRANLPAGLGQGLSFTALGNGNLNSIAQLEWQASVNGTNIDLTGWKQVMPDDWPAPVSGHGSFQMNASFTGDQPRRFNGKVDFAEVALKLPVWSIPLPQADPLQHPDENGDAKRPDTSITSAPVTAEPEDWQYSKVAVGFTSENTPEGWLTRFDNVQLARDESPWPAGNASVLLKFGKQDDGSSSVAALKAKAQTLVLDNLWPLLAYLPESESNAHWRAIQATGRLHNLEVTYEHGAQSDTGTDDTHLDLQLEFERVGVAPVGKVPGVTGLTGKVTATEANGSVQFDSTNVALSMPRIFRTPLPADRLTGKFDWTRSADGIALHSDDLVIENTDGKAQANLTLTIPPEGSAVIDMHATGTELEVAATPRYLPVGIMPEKVLSWLDSAFPAGKVKLAEAVLQGPLSEFPFRKKEGEFLIKAQIEGLQMNYQQGWMPATGLAVAAEFHNAGLKAVATSGRVNGLYLDHADGSIRDYRDSEFFIKALTHGDLGQGLSFVQKSPVGPAIGELFQRLSGKGALQAKVTMDLPLKQFDKRKVDIDVNLANSTVSLAEIQQQATQIQGSLHILNNEVTGADLKGQFLQGAFRMNAESLAGGHYNLVANGQLQAQPLTEFLNLPAWIRLSGATAYRYTMPGYAQRDSAGTRHLYSVTSDLQGLQIDLPEPVNKRAGTARSVRLDADMPADNAMQLRGSLGDLRTLVRLQLAGNKWQFDRAGLRADGVVAALPAHSGLRIEGRIASFTLDDWLRLDNSSDVKNVSKTGVTAGTRVQDILRAANVTIDRFRLYGFEWPSLRAVLQATDGGWRVDVASDQATGQVMVPYTFVTGSPLTLNMDNLQLTTGAEGNSTSSNSRTGVDPRDLPAIRADIKNFRFGEHDFGALQVTATRIAQGLQVDTLHIGGSSFTGAGKGSWLQSANGQSSSLSLTLDSSDVRTTLRQFNYGDYISGKRGKLVADLHWPGGLDDQILGRASGTLEVQVDEGQLLSVEPGAGRVLGLLSIAALPRRLGLDFRDLTDKGLAFDSVHANFNVTSGDARTQNLVLRGPTAEIGIVGRMGLGARDYDQTAVVTGNVTGALPMAAVVAGVPVAGAALLLFSQVFKEPLKGVARAYYHIGGSWDEPKVERIDADVGKASISGAESGVAP